MPTRNFVVLACGLLSALLYLCTQIYEALGPESVTLGPLLDLRGELLLPEPRRPSKRKQSQCAKDYEACGGGLLAPVGPMRCCSPGFYCFTRGAYFSQCRPRPMARRGKRKRFCGLDWGVCSAATGSVTRLECCNPGWRCVQVSSLYAQCVPIDDGKKKRWWAVAMGGGGWKKALVMGVEVIEAGKDRRVRYAFAGEGWAERARTHPGVREVTRVTAKMKLPREGPGENGLVVNGRIGRLTDEDLREFRHRVSLALHDETKKTAVEINNHYIIVQCTDSRDREDVAMALAAVAEVLQVSYAL